MKKGIFTYRNDITTAQQYEYIKAAGFDSVIVWWGEEKHQHLKLARKFGLEICNVHLPFDDIRKLWIPNNSGSDDYASWLCGQINDCKNYGIEIAVIHVSRGIDTYPPNEQGLDRLKRIVENAEKAKVIIAFENLRLLDYLDYTFDHIQSDYIGFCYDSGHQNCFSPERDVLDDYKDKLIALHIADNDGNDDIHSLPYDGTVDWMAFAKKLAEIKYTGVLSLEIQQDRNPIYEKLFPREFFELSFERAKKFEDEIKRFLK